MKHYAIIVHMKPYDNNELKQLIRRIQTGELYDAWLDDTLMDSIASNTVFTDNLSVFDDYVPEHDKHNKLVKLVKAVCHGVQTGDYHERYLPVLSGLARNDDYTHEYMMSIMRTMRRIQYEKIALQSRLFEITDDREFLNDNPSLVITAITRINNAFNILDASEDYVSNDSIHEFIARRIIDFTPDLHERDMDYENTLTACGILSSHECIEITCDDITCIKVHCDHDVETSESTSYSRNTLPANMIALLAMMDSITSTMNVMNGNAIMHSPKAWFMVADNMDMPVEYVREMLLACII